MAMKTVLRFVNMGEFLFFRGNIENNVELYGIKSKFRACVKREWHLEINRNNLTCYANRYIVQLRDIVPI
jgi:hypothetical protein